MATHVPSDSPTSEVHETTVQLPSSLPPAKTAASQRPTSLGLAFAAFGSDCDAQSSNDCSAVSTRNVNSHRKENMDPIDQSSRVPSSDGDMPSSNDVTVNSDNNHESTEAVESAIDTADDTGISSTTTVNDESSTLTSSQNGGITDQSTPKTTDSQPSSQRGSKKRVLSESRSSESSVSCEGSETVNSETVSSPDRKVRRRYGDTRARSRLGKATNTDRTGLNSLLSSHQGSRKTRKDLPPVSLPSSIQADVESEHQQKQPEQPPTKNDSPERDAPMAPQSTVDSKTTKSLNDQKITNDDKNDDDESTAMDVDMDGSDQGIPIEKTTQSLSLEQSSSKEEKSDSKQNALKENEDDISEDISLINEWKLLEKKVPDLKKGHWWFIISKLWMDHFQSWIKQTMNEEENAAAVNEGGEEVPPLAEGELPIPSGSGSSSSSASSSQSSSSSASPFDLVVPIFSMNMDDDLDAMNDAESKDQVVSKPSSIDNTHLLAPFPGSSETNSGDGDTTSCLNPKPIQQLKPRMEENSDFVFICEDQWIFLHSHFGGGPEIPRPVLETPNSWGDMFICLRPLKVRASFMYLPMRKPESLCQSEIRQNQPGAEIPETEVYVSMDWQLISLRQAIIDSGIVCDKLNKFRLWVPLIAIWSVYLMGDKVTEEMNQSLKMSNRKRYVEIPPDCYKHCGMKQLHRFVGWVITVGIELSCPITSENPLKQRHCLMSSLVKKEEESSTQDLFGSPPLSCGQTSMIWPMEKIPRDWDDLKTGDIVDFKHTSQKKWFECLIRWRYLNKLHLFVLDRKFAEEDSPKFTFTITKRRSFAENVARRRTKRSRFSPKKKARDSRFGPLRSIKDDDTLPGFFAVDAPQEPTEAVSTLRSSSDSSHNSSASSDSENESILGTHKSMDSSSLSKKRKNEGNNNNDDEEEGEEDDEFDVRRFGRWMYHEKSYERNLRDRRGTAGLKNLGNTCFMNSTIQCLAQTPHLVEYFLNKQYKKDINKRNPLGQRGNVAGVWHYMLDLMHSGKFRVLDPSVFKRVIGIKDSRFNGYGQQDSQELLSALLDGLHEDLNRVKKKPYVPTVESNGRPDSIVAKEAWDSHLLRNQSIIVDLLQGQYKSRVQCPDCDNVSITFDPYMYVGVPIPRKRVFVSFDFVSFAPFEGGTARPTRYTIELDQHCTVKGLKITLRNEFAPLSGRIDFMEDLYVCGWIPSEDSSVTKSEQSSERRDDSPVPMGKFLCYNSDAKVARMIDDCYLYVMYVPLINPYLQRSQFMKHLKILRENPTPVAVEPKQKKSEDSAGSVFADILPSESSESSSILPRSDNESDPVSDDSHTNNNGEISAAELLFNFPNEMQKEKIFENRHHYNHQQFVMPMRIYVKRKRNEHNKSTMPSADEDGGQKEEEEKDDLETMELRPMALKYGISANRWEEDRVVCFGLDIIFDVILKLKHVFLINNNGDNDSSLCKSADCMSEKRRMIEYIKSIIEEVKKEDDPKQTLRLKIKGLSIFFRRKKSLDRVKVIPEKKFSIADLNRMSELEVRLIFPDVTLDDRLINGGPNHAIIHESVGQCQQLLTEKLMKWRKSQACLSSLKQSKNKHKEESDNDGQVLNDEMKIIKDEIRQMMDSPITLHDCMESNTKEETLGSQDAWYCSKCKKHKCAKKRMDLWKCPDILIIHLKRFRYYQRRRYRINELVDFPINGLDMREWVECPDFSNEQDCTYDLFAVSNHIGSISGGHYTAYVKNMHNQRWYVCNDSNVSPLRSEDELISSMAYVLYYRRRKMRCETQVPSPAALTSVLAALASKDKSEESQSGSLDENTDSQSSSVSSSVSIAGNDDSNSFFPDAVSMPTDVSVYTPMRYVSSSDSGSSVESQGK